MANYTQAEARKEINAIGKKEGFILRKQKIRINGLVSYRFECRETGRVLISNMNFWSAYEHALNSDKWLDK